MNSFTYTGLPARVLFGFGTVDQLQSEMEKLGIKRPLLLTTPFQEEQGAELAKTLGLDLAGHFSNATMHTPKSVTDEALTLYKGNDADGVISLGGGSTINLGKAIAWRTDAPQICVPTSYAGSEMTSILGESEDGKKTTFRDLKLLPETVIYDVDFTMSLPHQMTVTSGMNAIAHAVEALYAENANPVLSLIAEDGIRALARALPKLTAALDDKQARYDALYGAWLCAVSLGSGGVALHHKLCHVLGGSFNLPHAETHTIVLPHAIDYNAPAIPEAMDRMRRATGSERPAQYLFNLAKDAGVPTALESLGMPESGIEKAVEITFDNPYYNPRPFERDEIARIIRQAWDGTEPAH